MFTNSNINVSFLLPKYFNIFALLESNIRVTIEDAVYNIPTNLTSNISDKNVEFIYADNAICNEKRKDKTYIRLIFFEYIFFD